MISWREEFEKVLDKTGDDFRNITCTLTDEELNQQFEGYYNPIPFTAWSANFVYFPVVYDIYTWVGYVPRHPNDQATNHIGGQ